jgi:uncharacterized protein
MFNNLNAEQIEAILDALPVEFIFVDGQNRLQYANRIDKRANKTDTSIIGKDIHGCHKQESRPRVDALIDNLRSGRSDEEVFWVSYEQKILNRFVAVRDKAGAFLGVMEFLFDFNAINRIAEERKDAHKLFP